MVSSDLLWNQVYRSYSYFTSLLGNCNNHLKVSFLKQLLIFFSPLKPVFRRVFSVSNDHNHWAVQAWKWGASSLLPSPSLPPAPVSCASKICLQCVLLLLYMQSLIGAVYLGLCWSNALEPNRWWCYVIMCIRHVPWLKTTNNFPYHLG